MASKKTTKKIALTYTAACKLCRQGLDSGDTHHTIAKRLMAKGYPTATGGSKWYHDTVRRAAEKAAQSESSQDAPRQKENQSSVSALPLQRRGLKRMISADEWESMPEDLRERVAHRIADRMVG